MKNRTTYLFSAIAGPLLIIAGLAGMFGIGLPGPYWLAVVFFGAALILFGQRGLRKNRIISETDSADMEGLAIKRHRFWIFVAIASSLYGLGAYSLPSATPEERQHLVVVIMQGTFGLCAGIFLYALFTGRKP